MFRYLLSLKKLPLLIIILVFFLGDNVMTKYGFSLQQHKMILLIMCCLSFMDIVRKGKRKCPQAIALLCFVALYTIFKSITDASPGSRMMGITVLLPVFVFLAFISMEDNTYRYKGLLYAAYIAECSIAIIERVLHINIFQLGISDHIIDTSGFDTMDFRSIGLYGHPLQNSCVIMAFIAFILVYENRVRLKYGLALLGILGIFCFNTRAAIVTSCGSLLLYFFYWMRKGKVGHNVKVLSLLMLACVCGVIFYLFTQGIIGGRLSSMGLYDDDSAAVRVAVWSVFDYYDLKDFILGINYNELEMLKYKTGLFAIENFWLNWLFSYGLVFVVGLVLFYYKLMKKIFADETMFNKLFLIVPFIALASTNPSLAVSIVPMTAFLLLSNIMPQTRR